MTLCSLLFAVVATVALLLGCTTTTTTNAFTFISNRGLPSCLFATRLSEEKEAAATQQQQQQQVEFLPPNNNAIVNALVEKMAASKTTAQEWSNMFGLTPKEACFHALFDAIRQVDVSNENQKLIGLQGQPFKLNQVHVCKAMETSDDSPFAGYFTFADLARAVDNDFLDAGRGTTDNRKGWKMHTVSQPRGNSFEQARMTLEDVHDALSKGTVIFNSAGANIVDLAGATLACTDATALPNALNLYVTSPSQRTSAPPHTDKQDVLVVQTTGAKHWRIYSPPEASKKPSADMFARGKGTDNLPLFSLESEWGCKLLLETTMAAGDVLFIPAAFPHTTDTADLNEETSMHLTFGLDTRIWDLDYLNLRALALKRAHVQDSALGIKEESDNQYEGKLNELPQDVRNDLLEALPMGFLSDDKEGDETMIAEISNKAEAIAQQVDGATANAVSPEVWKDATARLQQHGRELLEIHRDMYTAAMEERETRQAEAKMTAHLHKDDDEQQRKALTPEQVQRLSVFRVKRHFDRIDKANKALQTWSYEGKPGSDDGAAAAALPDDWQFTMPLKVGDQVEADLGGAFFPAAIARVVPGGGGYDVTFFDGDAETGMDRSQIKLLVPPTPEPEVDTSSMTPKQLKRWKKQQEKKNKKQK